MNSHALKSVLLALSLTVLISSSACATSPPSEYRQGAFVPVEAPVFEPSQDAPHTFRPDAPPRVEPGPRPTRVLPETPETRRGPGLWSADPPSSSAPMSPADPVILDVRLPFHPLATSPLEESPTRICARSLREAMAKSGVGTTVESRPLTVRRCIIALGYKHCASKLEALAYGSAPSQATKAEWVRITREAHDEAQRFADMACKGVPGETRDTDMLERWLKVWEAMTS